MRDEFRKKMRGVDKVAKRMELLEETLEKELKKLSSLKADSYRDQERISCTILSIAETLYAIKREEPLKAQPMSERSLYKLIDKIKKISLEKN